MLEWLKLMGRQIVGLLALTALLYWIGPYLAVWIKFPAWLPALLEALRIPGALLMATGAGWMIYAMHTPTMTPTNGAQTEKAAYFNLRIARRTSLIAGHVSNAGGERNNQKLLADQGIAIPVSEGDILVIEMKYEGVKETAYIAYNLNMNIYAINKPVMDAMFRLGSVSTTGSAIFYGAVMVGLSGPLWLAPLTIAAVVAGFESLRVHLTNRYREITIKEMLLPSLREIAEEVRQSRANGGG